MKSLILEQEHRDKLLEMCKSLFPEYTDWKFGPMSEYAHYDIWFRDEKNEGIEIHWFEFCTFHLAKRIYVIGHQMVDYFGYCVVIESQHPIDFLYKEYKKKR